jgi:hypothetical protein
MRISTALFMSGSLLALAIPLAHAGDKPLPPELPTGYDLSTLSRGPSKMTPGLDPPKNMGDTATILQMPPTADGKPGARIEWSGYMLMGLGYKNSRTR